MSKAVFSPRGEQPGPIVIGHRGAPGFRPEHTESSYRLAFELGADAVEPDIVATRDGVLVVRHENEISTTTDVASHRRFADRRRTATIDGSRITGWFTEDFIWEELQELRCVERLPKLRPENRRFDGTERVLRLADVLRIADESVRADGTGGGVVVEIKHAHYFHSQGHDLVGMLLRELEAAGWEDRRHRLAIESFELGALERLRAERVPWDLVFLLEHAGRPADEETGSRGRDYAWYRSDAGLAHLAQRVSGISPAKRDLMREGHGGRARGASSIVERAHAHDLSVFTWTLRPENRFLNPAFRNGSAAEHGRWQDEFSLIIGTGVDGIFVDHPDLGAAAARARL